MNKLCCFSPLCVPVAFRQTSYTNGASPASNSNQTTGNQNGSTQEVWKLLLSLFFPGVFPRPFVGYRKFNPSCDLLISFPINSLDANEKPRWLTCVFLFYYGYIFFTRLRENLGKQSVCYFHPLVIVLPEKCVVQGEGPIEWGHLLQSHQTVDDHRRSHPPHCSHRLTVTPCVRK